MLRSFLQYTYVSRAIYLAATAFLDPAIGTLSVRPTYTAYNMADYKSHRLLAPASKLKKDLQLDNHFEGGYFRQTDAVQDGR
jgi:hypothetical protein